MSKRLYTKGASLFLVFTFILSVAVCFFPITDKTLAVGAPSQSMSLDWKTSRIFAAATERHVADSTVPISSPTNKVTGEVKTISGQLLYTVKHSGKTVIEESKLGILMNGSDIGRRVRLGKPITTTPAPVSYSILGNHSSTTDIHTLTTIPVTDLNSGLQYKLDVKVFDNGFAFRYVIPQGTAARSVSGESTSFKLPAGSTAWYSTEMYEGMMEKANIENITAGTNIAPPMTVQLPGNDGFAAITEGRLVNYAGMRLISTGNRNVKANFDNGGQPWIMTEDVTPWRIITVSSDLNGLVNNDIVFHVSDAQHSKFDKEDWIRPGLSLWSWLNGGEEAVTPDNMKLYIDYAAKLNIPYNLIDEGWINWSTADATYWDKLKEVIDYGNARGVGTWVWIPSNDPKGIDLYDRIQRREFFRKMQDFGAVGVKIDFIKGEDLSSVNFYRDALSDAADFKLMVNFHGSNKPTGMSRTYPNELTREGVRGLEWMQSMNLPATHNVMLPFTRYLAGPADYTPLAFTNPKLLGDTSWSSQLAMLITFTSPLMVIAEHPETLSTNPAVELVKNMPTTWDETVVLPGSELGGVSTFARRKGTTWYVAVINGLKAREMDLKLSFLGKGKFQALIYADNMSDQRAYTIENKVVNKGDSLHANMRASGGYVAKLSKLSMKR